MNCDFCCKSMTPGETLIAWDETDSGTVARMRFTHRGECDDARLYCSAGAAYGKDWDPEHERNGVAKKPFVIEAEKAKLLALLDAQQSVLA